MLKTILSTLRQALPCLMLAVALIAAVVPAPVTHAGAAAPTASEAWFDGLLDAFRAWMPTPVGVATSASDAGSDMDHNAVQAESEAGSDMMDPDGLYVTSTSDGGDDMESNGEAEAGGSMDPNG